MLIAGAGNLGLHTLDQLLADQYENEIVFFDEKCLLPESIRGRYRMITSFSEAATYFDQEQHEFVCTVGQPRIRERLTLRMQESGGKLSSVVSKNVVFMSSFSTLGEGSIIQPGCAVSHHVSLGKSCLVHASSLLGHDVMIDDFVTIGSMVNILKGVSIGRYSTISPSVLIYPNIRIGAHAYIEPGVVVVKDVEDHQTLSR